MYIYVHVPVFINMQKPANPQLNCSCKVDLDSSVSLAFYLPAVIVFKGSELCLFCLSSSSCEQSVNLKLVYYFIWKPLNL